MLQLFDGTRVQMEHVLPKDGRNELQVTAVFSCPPIPDAPFAGTIPSSEYVLHSSMKETFAGMAERALSSPVSFQDKVHLGHASLHFLRNQGGMLPRMVATVRKRSHKGTTAMGCFPQHLHVGLNPIVTNANDSACGTMNPDTCSMAHETYEDQEHLKQSVVRIWHPALGSAVAVRFHVFVDGAKGEVAAVNFTPDNPLWYIGLLRCKLSTELRGPLRDDLDDILNRAKFPPRTDCYKDTEEGRERFRMVHALLEGPTDSASYASFVSNREHRLELDPCLEQGHQDALLLKHDALPFQLHLVVDGARNATNGACIAGQVVPSLLRKAHTYASFAGALKGHRISPDGKTCLYDSATVDLQAQRYLSWSTIPTFDEDDDEKGEQAIPPVLRRPHWVERAGGCADHGRDVWRHPRHPHGKHCSHAFVRTSVPGRCLVRHRERQEADARLYRASAAGEGARGDGKGVNQISTTERQNVGDADGVL